MASTESVSELDSSLPPGPADLLVVVAAMLPEQLGGLFNHLSTIFPPQSLLIASESPIPQGVSSSLRVVPLASAGSGWSLTAPEYTNAWRLAQEVQAKAILMLGPGADSLAPGGLLQIANSVLGGSVDLAVPRYSLPPYAGLINSAILYPLTRALFATRARFPLAIDLGLSMRMAQRLATLAQKTGGADPAETLIWPVNEAAIANYNIDEFDVGSRTLPQPADADINTILARVTGSLFADIEAKAAHWQRARRTTPPRKMNPSGQRADGANDVSRMVDSFRLAYNNLLEIWSLVLPPHSLLGLKRLSALSATEFRMPDSLWARIVYDFLVAYRQRTINRGHLLGAFIPLYFGWVAGHINVTISGTDSEAHIEALAAAFEADKPYIVARWRWPDRFNA